MTMSKPDPAIGPQEANEYGKDLFSRNGAARPAQPISIGCTEEQLMDLALSWPDIQCFYIIISYLEPLRVVGIGNVEWEAKELLAAHLGGLSLSRVVWHGWVHSRGEVGCDLHLCALPLDLLTDKILPLFCRDRTMVAISEKLLRIWDLENNRASPRDWWRLSLEIKAPTNLRPHHRQWLADTHWLIRDALRAGSITCRADVVQALRDAGAVIVSEHYHHIAIKYENTPITLRGTFYSERFPFDTVSGTAGKIPARNPADCVAEIRALREALPPLLAKRAKLFRRFGRYSRLAGSPDLPAGLAKPIEVLRGGGSENSSPAVGPAAGGDQNESRDARGLATDDQGSVDVGNSVCADRRRSILFPTESRLEDHRIGGGTGDTRKDPAGQSGRESRNPSADQCAGDHVRGGRGDLGPARPGAPHPADQGPVVDLPPRAISVINSPVSKPAVDVAAANSFFDHFTIIEAELDEYEYKRTHRIRQFGESISRITADLRKIAVPFYRRSRLETTIGGTHLQTRKRDDREERASPGALVADVAATDRPQDLAEFARHLGALGVLGARLARTIEEVISNSPDRLISPRAPSAEHEMSL